MIQVRVVGAARTAKMAKIITTGSQNIKDERCDNVSINITDMGMGMIMVMTTTIRKMIILELLANQPSTGDPDAHNEMLTKIKV